MMEWKVGTDDEGRPYESAIGASGIEYVVRDIGGAWTMERISAGGEQLSLAQYADAWLAHAAAGRSEVRAQVERFWRPYELHRSGALARRMDEMS